MNRKSTSKKKAATNSVTFNVLIYATLFICGGFLCLWNDFLFGASAFALAVIFSSISSPWKDLATWAKITIIASTLFGVGALTFSIVAN